MPVLYQNLIFDLGNVIVDIDYNATYKAMSSLFRDDLDFKAMKRKVDDVTLQYEQGYISTELFLNKLMKEMHPNAHAKKVINAWNAMLLDIPADRLQNLKQLSESYRIIFLSNTNPLHIQWVDQYLLKTYNMSSFNEISPDVFYSHKVHDRKPNPSILEYILSKLDIEASKTLFFDDNLENISAALTVGIHAVHSPPEIDMINQTAGLMAKTQ